jgi:hypothetical protein
MPQDCAMVCSFASNGGRMFRFGNVRMLQQATVIAAVRTVGRSDIDANHLRRRSVARPGDVGVFH